eukprot:gnl/TRDRNA2_/TRDRNA2_104781_c0_seq1.p1 gnl/TRDRNA2_/TRDRNA2_104781_c0~~gnl/TRDRNA2_/TRDRNA2_104781_c0_seq1.p1  ORF type:complete len:325 (+),score=49.75 gnl/TRDRNA2_/TRDRNA2_104781_c0_seq1:164-1138(+)
MEIASNLPPPWAAPWVTPEAEAEGASSSSSARRSGPNAERWEAMMSGGISSFIAKHPETFKRRATRGIPWQYRWAVWKAALRLDRRREPGLFDELRTKECAFRRLIEVDAPRTFPDIPAFNDEYRESLRAVLTAYANFNTEVGYCQGMNFVVGLLLLTSERAEEDTFWVFTALMEDRCLNGFYKEKFPLLNVYLQAFDQLFSESVPELKKHFSRENMEPAVFLHQWFLSLYITCLPLPTVLMIWDGIVCNGLHVILPIAVALLKVLEGILSTRPYEAIVAFFKSMKRGSTDGADAVRTGWLLTKQSNDLVIPKSIMCMLQVKCV